MPKFLAEAISVEMPEVQKMTMGWAEDRLTEIQRYADAGDDSAALRAENFMHIMILYEVAKGHPDSQELARLAVKSSKIDFDRTRA